MGIRTDSTAYAESAAFEPRRRYLFGIAKPWKLDQALADLREQLTFHIASLEGRAESAHREALGALERGDASVVKPSGTEWSEEPTTVALGESGIVTRCQDEFTLTIRINIRAHSSSYGEQLSEAALATLRAR
jgi:hypothetical protein